MPANERGRPSAPAPGLGRQKTHSRRPQADRGLDAHDVGQAHRRQAVTEGGVDAVAGVGQHDASWHANRKCRLDLIKGDLRLGAEDDILRDTCLGPSLGIVRPGLRQIEPICYRQAGVIVGHRQAHSLHHLVEKPRWSGLDIELVEPLCPRFGDILPLEDRAAVKGEEVFFLDVHMLGAGECLCTGFCGNQEKS